MKKLQVINLLKSIKFLSDNSVKEFNIIKKFSSDLKATSMIMGVNLANANYPCPFCKFRFLGKKVASRDDVESYEENLMKLLH